MKILNLIYLLVISVLLAIIATVTSSKKVSAQAYDFGNGPVVETGIESTTLNRVGALYSFFKKRNSPLAEHSRVFIEVADKYGLDYRLLPAISCLESSCGIKMPYQSYNAWGWGVYGTNVIRFNSFEDGIERVAKGLYEGYIIKGADTPEKIAPIYNPPTHQSWLNKVNYFMKEIDRHTI